VTNSLVVGQQVDEPGDFKVVDGDLRLLLRRDDQVFLLRPVQLQVPRRDAVDAAACEIGARKVRVHEVRAGEIRLDEVRPGEVRPGEVRFDESAQ
jgi:hypothetical protein